MASIPAAAPTGRLVGPYNYFFCSSILDTGGSSSALTHLVAGSSSGPVAQSGWLHSIVVGTPLAGPGPVTVWDSAGSSTKPITIVGSSASGTYVYDVGFSNFLTVSVPSSTTPATITVTWMGSNL